MIRIAGKKHSPICLIEHVGRHSGNKYRIPILVAPQKDGFVFALTYGTGVDWYRNVLASKSALLIYKEKTYILDDPQVVETRRGQNAFAFPANLILRLIAIQDFFFMRTL